MSDNVVGQLKVLLTAELGSYVSDMGKAAHIAQQSARDISKEFASLQRVASQTFGAFGALNPVISQMSYVISSGAREVLELSRTMQQAGRSMGDTAKQASTLGAIGGILGAIAGSAIAAAAGIAYLAVSGGEVTKRFELISEKTGIAIRDLQVFEAAGKTVGVSLEDMVTSMRKFDQSITSTGRNSQLADAVLKGLGVTSRDNKEALLQLADAFQKMPDGPRKMADAVALLGRSGANMIPWLDKGRQGILEFKEIVDQYGPSVTAGAVSATEDWEKATTKLSLAWDNLKVSLSGALTLMAGATSGVATAFKAASDTAVELLKETAGSGGEGSWKSFLGGLSRGGPTEGLVDVETNKFARDSAAQNPPSDRMGRAAQDLFKKFDDERFEEQKQSFERERAGGPAAYALQKQNEDIAAAVQSDHYDIAKKLQEQIPALEAAAAIEKGRGATNAAMADSVQQMLQNMEAEAAAQSALAGATNLTAAGMLLQKATGEADVEIARERYRLQTEAAKLEQDLAAARSHPAQVASGEASRIQTRIGEVRKLQEELEKVAPLMERVTTEKLFGTEAARIGGELNTEGLGFGRQINGLIEINTAYKQGNTAVAAADIEKQLEPDKQEVAKLQEFLANANPFAIKGQGPSVEYLKLSQSLENANARLEEHRAQLKEIAALNISAEIGKEQRAFIDEAAAVQGLSSAYLESAAAVREFEVNRKVAQFGIEHPGSSTQQINDVRKLYREQSEQEFTLSISQEAPQFELGRGAADAIERLQGVKEELEKAGKTTILIDFAIDKAGADDAISKAKQLFEVENSRLVIDASIYDAQRAQIEQFDQLSNKVGTLGDRFRAMANDIALEGQNLGEKIFNSFNKAIDGIEDQMAKLIVTGRSDFRKMFEGIEENLIKSGLQAAFGELTNVAGFGVQKDKETEGPLKPAGALLASLPISPNGPAPTDGTDSKSTAGGFLAGLQKMALGAIGIKTPDARAAAEKTKPLGTRGDPIFVSFTQTNSAAVNAPQRPAGFELPAAAPASVGLPQLGAQGTATTPPIFSPLPPATGTPDSGNTAGAALQEAGSIARLAGSAVPGPGGQTLRSVTSTISPVISLVKLLEQHSATTTALQPGGNILGSLPIPKSPLPDLSAIASTLPSDTGTGSSESAAAAAKSIQGVPEAGQDNSSGPQLYGPNGPSTASTAIGLAGAGLNLSASIIKFLQLLTPKEAGGPVTPGRSFLVGEKGPEIFSPNTAGTIIPNHVFAGFRAEGGDVAPGKSYMVGEQGFEVFQEDSGRTAVPSSIFETNSSSSTSSRSRSSRTQHTVVNQNFPNVKDADNFRRSKGQVLAEFHAQASIANKRNG